MDEKLLLDAREVAHLLGISLRTLDDLISKKKAPPHIRLTSIVGLKSSSIQRTKQITHRGWNLLGKEVEKA